MFRPKRRQDVPINEKFGNFFVEGRTFTLLRHISSYASFHVHMHINRAVLAIRKFCSCCFMQVQNTVTRSHPEVVCDMSRVTLNFDLSKIPFVHF